jgi:hypothetical protein
MSVQVSRIFPGGIFPVWKGLLFEPESWDGSDFFMPAQRFGKVRDDLISPPPEPAV